MLTGSMKTAQKQKTKRPEKVVREVGAKYRTMRQPPRKRANVHMLTPEELVALAERMIAANDANDQALLRRLKREFTNGFYGEIRA